MPRRWRRRPWRPRWWWFWWSRRHEDHSAASSRKDLAQQIIEHAPAWLRKPRAPTPAARLRHPVLTLRQNAVGGKGIFGVVQPRRRRPMTLGKMRKLGCSYALARRHDARFGGIDRPLPTNPATGPPMTARLPRRSGLAVIASVSVIFWVGGAVRGFFSSIAARHPVHSAHLCGQPRGGAVLSNL
jgi:hypothetical protein